MRTLSPSAGCAFRMLRFRWDEPFRFRCLRHHEFHRRNVRKPGRMETVLGGGTPNALRQPGKLCEDVRPGAGPPDCAGIRAGFGSRRNVEDRGGNVFSKTGALKRTCHCHRRFVRRGECAFRRTRARKSTRRSSSLQTACLSGSTCENAGVISASRKYCLGISLSSHRVSVDGMILSVEPCRRKTGTRSAPSFPSGESADICESSA